MVGGGVPRGLVPSTGNILPVQVKCEFILANQRTRNTILG